MCSCCEHSNWQQFLGLSTCITDLHPPERAWAGQNSLPQDAWHFFLPMCPTSKSTCIFQYMFELPRCPKWILIITLYRFSYEPPCFIGILHCHVTCLIVSEGISGGFPMQRDKKRVRCDRWARLRSSPLLMASTADAWVAVVQLGDAGTDWQHIPSGYVNIAIENGHL